MSSNITKLTAKLKSVPDESLNETDIDFSNVELLDTHTFADLLVFFSRLSERSYRRGFQQGVELSSGDSGNGRFTAKDLGCELRHKGHLDLQLMYPSFPSTFLRFILEGEDYGLKTLCDTFVRERLIYIDEEQITDDYNELDALSDLDKYLKEKANNLISSKEPGILSSLGLLNYL